MCDCLSQENPLSIDASASRTPKGVSRAGIRSLLRALMKTNPLLRIALPALLILPFLSSCSNHIAAYNDLLVGEPSVETSEPQRGDVHITYLGTNGYLFRSHDSTIAVDPYFSRIPIRPIALNAPISPSPQRIDYATTQAAFPKRVDAWLITHSHFDHLFDAPALQPKFGGKIVSSHTGRFLAQAQGVPLRNLRPSEPGRVYHFGGAKVSVLEAKHDTIFGMTPYPGKITEPMSSSPNRPKDWLLGTPLAYLIEMEGKRIYVESGGVPGFLPPVKNVDLAIIGTAVPDSQSRFPGAVRKLNPRYVLPSHQDNFFLPLENGFQFSTLSNLPQIKARHKAEQLPGELILMDYFHTWKLR